MPMTARRTFAGLACANARIGAAAAIAAATAIFRIDDLIIITAPCVEFVQLRPLLPATSRILQSTVTAALTRAARICCSPKDQRNKFSVAQGERHITEDRTIVRYEPLLKAVDCGIVHHRQVRWLLLVQ